MKYLGFGRSLVWAAVMVVLALNCTSTVLAQCDATWINSNGGDWSLGSNWQSGQVPVPGDDVCITQQGTYTVAVHSNVSIGSLDLGAASGFITLVVNDTFLVVHFSVDGPVFVGNFARLQVTNSVIQTPSGGSITNSGSFELHGGVANIAVSNKGSIVFEGDSYINGALSSDAGSSIEAMTGTSGNFHLTIASGFTNNGQIYFPMGGDVSLTVSSGVLVNSVNGVIDGGSIAKARSVTQTSSVSITAEIQNFGAINALSVDLIFDADGVAHTNELSGIIDLTDAGIFFDLTGTTARAASSFTNAGTLDIGSGMKAGGDEPALVFSGGTFNFIDGTLSGAGTLRFVSSVFQSYEMFNETNTIEFINSSATGSSHLGNNSVVRCLGMVNFAGILDNDISGELLIEGDVLTGPATLVVAQDFYNAGTVVLNNTDTLPVAVLFEINGGQLTNDAGGAINVHAGGGGSRTIAALISNSGLIELIDSDLTITGGNFNHYSDGTILVTGGDLFLDLADPTTRAASSFTNAGTLDIGDGQTCYTSSAKAPKGVEAASSFTNAGTLDIGSGASFVYSGDDFGNQISGTISGEGELDVSGATSASNAGTLSPGSSPGTLTVTGDIDQVLTAKIEIEIANPIGAGPNDLLVVSGAINLRGSLDVSLVSPYHPAEGDQFTVVTFGSRTNAFDGFNLPGLLGGLSWSPDVRSDRVVLDVVCGNGPDLSIDLVADKDPVSTDHVLTYAVTVMNHRTMPANGVTVSNFLPLDMFFEPSYSSPQCSQVFTGKVECSLAIVGGNSSRTVYIAMTPTVPGIVNNVVSVALDECDVDPSDNEADVDVVVTDADPCDADGSYWIDQYDLPVAAGYIFGGTAGGNPDCSDDGTVDAEDLSSTIISVDENNP